MEENSLIKHLLKPSSYPHKPGYVKYLQTHISHVFIVPPYVYKIKKPVNFGFLDFSTLKKRKYYCEKEVELNSRNCDAYLGIEEISIQNGEFVFGTGDEIIEYAVKMRRLPEKYFLTNLLKRERVSRTELLRVVKKLEDFYKKQPVTDFISDFGRPERIRINIDENFTLSERFIGKTISPPAFDAIKFYNNRFFEKRSALFEKRIQNGFIRDCHGDLHLEHIHLSPQEVCIFDCIEFNERFRYIDIASDIGFLAMDLDYHGYSEYADFVVSQLSERMGDETIYEVIDFYKCYKAYVRGKIESISSSEQEIPLEERMASEIRAKKYYQLALKYALFGSLPGFIVIFGLIGTGKSTLAQAISEDISCPVISSDIVRKEIMGVRPTERRYVEYDNGIYSGKNTEITYNELLNRGRKAIEEGKPVILDASFSKREFRERVLKEAQSLGVLCYFIETKILPETIKERLIDREKKGQAVSDGRWGIFERFKNEFEEPNELPRDKYMVVTTENTMEETEIKTFREIIRMRI